MGEVVRAIGLPSGGLVAPALRRATLAQPALELAAGLELEPSPRGPRHPVTAYLATLAAGSQTAQEGALSIVAGLAGFSGPWAVPWEAWRFEHQAGLRARLVDGGYAPATANRYLGAVRGVLTAAWRLGLVDSDALERVRDVPPVGGSRLPAGRALELPEIAALFGACDLATARGSQVAALLALLLGCGLRLHEPLSLELGDVGPGGVTVIGKGNKERMVPLAEGFAPYLEPWRARRGETPGPWLCPVHRSGALQLRRLGTRAAARSIQLYAERAQVVGVQSHDLRRTMISALLDAGVDVLIVGRIAGHARPETTVRYDRRAERAVSEGMRRVELAPKPRS